eukprot:TRINITY_DN15156_c0_g1_i2.p1 TRINITY_DN15156_c0_g1~~TRINITY_DN15156_c0_g1_i2.p1  ORF type:complete len:287 (-),score=18.24 TRINITY_DN15156_c0_g1_i2:261-1073(-)
MVSIEAVENFYERLLADDSTKDVSIQMSDGTVQAHSCILAIGSEAIRGMLFQGAAANTSPKRLSWEEHPSRTGKFFIRLLYTGTLAEEEWSVEEESLCVNAACTQKSMEVPLELLLGGVGLAKMYLFLHLLEPLTTALSDRLHPTTFNSICKCAIKFDITSLRLRCVEYARDEFQKVQVPWKRIMSKIYEGCNPAKVAYVDELLKQYAGKEMQLLLIICKKYKVSIPDLTEYTSQLRRMMDGGELAPEVRSEMASILRETNTCPKRRRTF